MFIVIWLISQTYPENVIILTLWLCSYTLAM